MTHNHNANSKKSVRKEKQQQQRSRSSSSKTKDLDPSKRDDFSSASSSSDEETSASRKLAAENALKNASSSSKPLQKKARTFDENAMEAEPTEPASLIPLVGVALDASSSSSQPQPQPQSQQMIVPSGNPKISLRVPPTFGNPLSGTSDALTKNIVTPPQDPSYF